MTLLYRKNDVCTDMGNALVSSRSVKFVWPTDVTELSGAIFLAISGYYEVNKLTTSSETCDSEMPSVVEEIDPTNLQEFTTLLSVSN